MTISPNLPENNIPLASDAQLRQKIIKQLQQVFTDEIFGLQEILARLAIVPLHDNTSTLAAAELALNDSSNNAANLQQNFCKAVLTILNCKGKVIITGMGKSGHIAGKIAATLASTGTPAFFVHPAEALHGDLGMIDKRDVVIAISYSGESDELIAMLLALKQKQVPIIAFTGNLSSALAKLADCLLNMKISREACPLNLAPTTTTTVSLVMGDALAIALLTVRAFNKEDFARSHPSGSLGRRLLTKVADIMHTGDSLPVVYVNTQLKEVIVEISQKSLGFCAVIATDFTLLGIITDGDLRRVFKQFDNSNENIDAKTNGKLETNILNMPASAIMNKNAKTLSSDSLAMLAIDLIEQYKITGFLVTDQDNKLIGVFNLHDLFRAKLL